MPDAPSRELKAFIDALDTAFENPPRDLPDGTMDLAKELGQKLRGYGAPDGLSPGEKAAKEAANPGAVPYPDAVKGPDQPSPGQREYQELAQQAQDLAARAGSLASQG